MNRLALAACLLTAPDAVLMPTAVAFIGTETIGEGTVADSGNDFRVIPVVVIAFTLIAVTAATRIRKRRFS